MIPIDKDKENKAKVSNKVEKADLVDNYKAISEARSYSFMGNTYDF